MWPRLYPLRLISDHDHVILVIIVHRFNFLSRSDLTGVRLVSWLSLDSYKKFQFSKFHQISKFPKPNLDF